MQPLCHEDESSALLQFKHSFVIAEFASGDASAYPKTESWKLSGNTSDCCSWDGVECDRDTSHVIGLDLSSSLLNGFINSSSSLFNLVHLHRLNLADNHFNYSHIPDRIGSLSRLTSLNLSSSAFSDQIPVEILSLSKLAFLDLSGKSYGHSKNLLKLENPSLRDLVQNLTNLKVLDLSFVNISSIVPGAMSNLSSLTILRLASCFMYGEFPMGIFRLPSLQILNMTGNDNLRGSLPEFHHGSPLEDLFIAHTSFFGTLPNSIANLESLRSLDLGHCNFYGALPSSIANLSQLTQLRLSFNHFDARTLPSQLGRLSKLTHLTLRGTKLWGEIPPSLANLTQLSFLAISHAELVGQIPSWLGNLTRLTHLDLSFNQLQGAIPFSISQIKHLEYLNLVSNNLSGEVELDHFLKLQSLAALFLSYNKLTVLTKNHTNATLPKLNRLGLRSCNLRQFPKFLQFQEELVVLRLAHNNIHGQIPTWLWNTTKETMKFVDLNQNFLTGFEQHPEVIPWMSLVSLDVSFNMLQGSLPLPPPSIGVYQVASNLLTGEIPPSFCQRSSLFLLDLSDNYLSGTVPQCLASSSTDSLLLLNLSSNNFHGTIPQTFTRGIKMIDLSHNQLHGEVPRSLASCKMLEVLVLGDNQIEDTFPFWLGALPELQVLVLRSNRFHGAIENPKTGLKFPKLRVVDLSHNGFSGNLPSKYFENWNAMKVVKKGNATYMRIESSLGSDSDVLPGLVIGTSYAYSITIANKGTERLYEKIQSVFVAIDLSNNNFSGGVPESVGSLSGLQMLNISNNNLTGLIPSSLANLMELESLDLSRNQLSGQIPQQLTQLTFLSVLNLSHNRLEGPIPRGKQFDTFDNSSYAENLRLCGVPLSRLCGTLETSPPPLPPLSTHSDDSNFQKGIYWLVIAMGYGSGLIVGLVIGHILTTRYHEWFVGTFGREKKTQKKQRRGRRN